MKVTPISDALAEEHVLDVRPAFALYPQVTWKRRLKHYSGRALTHTALTREQLWLNGEMAGLGRALSSGVLHGLNLVVKSEIENEIARSKLYLQAGRGLSLTGESIAINRDTSCYFTDVFVFQHDLLEAEHEDESLASQTHALGLPTLQDLLDAEVELPRAGILVLEALYAEISESPEQDVCGEDPSNYAFENWQLQDACRLVLYTWPENWIPLPAEDAQWRNRLAAAIFDKERILDGKDFHPWEKLGVPLALVAMDENFNIQFVDRPAVMRQAGRINIDNNGIEDGGSPLLWQARFEQFNTQLATLIRNLGKVDNLAQLCAADFRYLPPVGVLPKPFADPRANKQEFFPVNISVNARVLPYEQLDIAIRESQPLLPFDMQAFDDVELLVPVAQSHFDPKLLQVEVLDPTFDESIRRFTATRNEWLGRRELVRQKLATLYLALEGKPLDFGVDTDRLDSLELPAPQQQVLIEQGASWRMLKGNSAPPANWMNAEFSEANTSAVITALGYGRAPWTTELTDMRGAYSSIFLRRAFLLDAQDLENRFVLRVNTNAGFVVYLNGQEIQRFNLASTISSTSHNATSLRPLTVQEFELNLDASARNLLKPGLNTLAMQVHIYSVKDQSFLFVPRLLQQLSLRNYLLTEVKEDNFGLSLSPESEEAPESTYIPQYVVDLIVELLTEIGTENSPLSAEEQEELSKSGLKEFIYFLESKVNSANDKVDFSFVRLQTEIYRVRQFMLGNTESTKLATSPILASIAKGESAAATREEINSFVQGLKAARESVAAASIASTTETGSGVETPSITTSATRSLSVSSDIKFFSTALGSASVSDFSSPKLTSGFVAEKSLVDAALVKDVISIDRSTTTLEKTDAVFVAAAESGINILSLGKSKEASSLFGSSATRVDIEEQNAVVGATSQYRNVTVAERLQEPVATNTRMTGVAAKAESIQSFLDVGINVADIKVPGFRNENGQEVEFSFADIRSNNRVAEILANQHDENVKDSAGNELGDESAYFSSGVRALENSAVVLRKIEGRIHAYKKIIQRCREIQSVIETNMKLADGRLAEIGNQLAEARHDLSIARVLRQEAAEEVKRINQQRDSVINRFVPYFLFRRPRFSFSWKPAPARPLVPVYEQSVLNLCLDGGQEIPDELLAIVDLLKNAPLKWLTIGDEVLALLNKASSQNPVIEKAAGRTVDNVKRHKVFQQASDKTDLRSFMMYSAYESSYTKLTRGLTQIKNTELVNVLRSSWTEKKTKLKQFATLDDVLSGISASSKAGKLAAEELANLRNVVACLYKRFGDISPAIKLHWIEKLSQFDDAISLRNLYNLPRWNEVDGKLRKDMQKLNTWFYSRFDATWLEAEGLASNIVRMCMLLASSSPVNKIIAGALPEQTAVEQGGNITVAVNTKEVFVGMEVSVQGLGKSLAKGKVKDIRDGYAVAEIIQADRKAVEVPANTRVHFNNKQYNPTPTAPAKAAQQASAPAPVNQKIKTQVKTNQSHGTKVR